MEAATPSPAPDRQGEPKRLWWNHPKMGRYLVADARAHSQGPPAPPIRESV